MKTILSAASILVLAGIPAIGHRLDEYLQASLLSLDKDRVHVQIRLTPGVAVLPIVLASIDSDANEILSETEQRGYAERVLHDLSLSVDGDGLRLQLVSMRFPGVLEMKEGLGEIQLDFEASVPHGKSGRRLIFENHHQSSIATYLVNCLVPQDKDIRINAQNRNYQQSFYQLDYTQAGERPPLWPSAWLSGTGVQLGIVGLLLSARFAFLWRQRLKLRSEPANS